ncbi:nitrous oxide reductase accessory protein NosL [Maribacter sp. 2304DJ31-5]|uniref:nitrous oxide reductase accessory protein NosL n=1 Tax=Maribacter sp. 2304DJ31-5 TaxID=3386273 RepID=UPI0039BD303F
MKCIKRMYVLYLCLIFTQLSYGQIFSCGQCKMDINDQAFKAQLVSDSEKIVQFDAIECLVNFLKTKEEANFKKILITDYHSGELIDAIDAYYVKSKAVPSPMGANLSAYKSKTDALAVTKKNGGEVYTWTVLKSRFVSSNFGGVHHKHHNRPDAYAPSGIMGDHLHPKGGLMVSVRYMNMGMEGNRDGRDKITDETIYRRFMVAPQDMTMQMYMLGVMYAPSDRLTLMLMQNVVKKDMDLTARMMMENGMPMLRDFSTSSNGLGDLKMGVLYGLLANEKINLHTNIKLNIPVGDIKNRDATPMMANAKLPYAMQLGSGTFDITIGGTLKGTIADFSWGIQQLNTFRTGGNSQGYRFGNLHELHIWGAYALSQKVSASLRTSGSSEGRITGVDPELNPMMVTTVDPDNYGGELLRGAIGINILLAKNKLVLGTELGTPLYQNYNGIFMNETVNFSGSLKYTLL